MMIHCRLMIFRMIVGAIAAAEQKLFINQCTTQGLNTFGGPARLSGIDSPDAQVTTSTPPKQESQATAIWLDSPNLSDHPSVPYIPLHLSLDSLESLYHTIMASSSREAPVNQHISGLTVSDVKAILLFHSHTYPQIKTFLMNTQPRSFGLLDICQVPAHTILQQF